MSIKRMSLRFNLDNEADRKAWKHLKNTIRVDIDHGKEAHP